MHAGTFGVGEDTPLGDEDRVVEDPLSWAPVAVQAVTAVSERRRAPVRAVLAKGRVLEMKSFIAQLPFSYVTWVIQ